MLWITFWNVCLIFSLEELKVILYPDLLSWWQITLPVSMGAAGWDQSWNVLVVQGCFMEEQQQQLNEINAKINQLTEAFTQVASSCPIPPATAAASPAAPLAITPNPLISWPYKFPGETSQCQGFLVQCDLYFTAQEGASDQSKIAQFLNMLMGRALSWVMAVLEKECIIIHLLHWTVPEGPWPHPGGKRNCRATSGCKTESEKSSQLCTGIPEACSRQWLEWTWSESCVLPRSKC